MLSNQEILPLHFLQTDLPPIERPLGRRQIKTLANEPKIRPKRKKNVKDIKEDS